MPSAVAIAAAFAKFDVDGSGTLDRAELVALLTATGQGSPISTADANSIIDDFDDDGDGVLSLSELTCAFSEERTGDRAAAVPRAPAAKPSAYQVSRWEAKRGAAVEPPLKGRV